MKKIIVAAGIAAGCLLASNAFAHTALCDCFDNGDGTITCEGGFSDGSSASGVELFVRDDNGKTVLKGKMNEDSEYTFKKPSGKYEVEFFAGEGHSVKIKGEDILE